MAKYLITRKFNLISGHTDWQYVSSINTKSKANGYDKKREYALALTEWQCVRVTSDINFIGAEYKTEQVEYNGFLG
jgi:hypothetical protein